MMEEVRRRDRENAADGAVRYLRQRTYGKQREIFSYTTMMIFHWEKSPTIIRSRDKPSKTR